MKEHIPESEASVCHETADTLSCHDHDHDHTCAGHHHHINVSDTSGSRLLMTLAINFIIPVVQIIGGMFAGSVALISDAVHNFSDFTAVLIAYFALQIGKKGASLYNTFGYQRSEVLAAAINVVILVGASAFIVYEAIYRFRNPEPVSGYIVIWIAGVGVLGNGLSAWLLHRDAEHSLNIRGAFLHMLGDFLTSVAVLISGVILTFKDWYWIDPLLSLLIVCFILKNCWSVLKEAGDILMNATPKSINLAEIGEFMAQLPDVAGVHYLHAWNISSTRISFSAHIVVKDRLLSETEILAEHIRQELLHHFGIDHVLLQFETRVCGKGGLLCGMSCGGELLTDDIRAN